MIWSPQQIVRKPKRFLLEGKSNGYKGRALGTAKGFLYSGNGQNKTIPVKQRGHSRWAEFRLFKLDRDDGDLDLVLKRSSQPPTSSNAFPSISVLRNQLRNLERSAKTVIVCFVMSPNKSLPCP
jgi:hypothetical protein